MEQDISLSTDSGNIATVNDAHMQALGDRYGIILRRQDPAAMLLGNILQFRFPDVRIDNPVAALQRTFLGKHVPVEAFQVNMTALSPQKLCSHLQAFNPGVYLQHLMNTLSIQPSTPIGSSVQQILPEFSYGF